MDKETQIEEGIVECVNCAGIMLPENALMRGGMPFCDEFCYGTYLTKQYEEDMERLDAENKTVSIAGGSNAQPGELTLVGPALQQTKITLKMSAKGDKYWDITDYQKPGETIEQTVERIVVIDEMMKERFA